MSHIIGNYDTREISTFSDFIDGFRRMIPSAFTDILCFMLSCSDITLIDLWTPMYHLETLSNYKKHDMVYRRINLLQSLFHIHKSEPVPSTLDSV